MNQITNWENISIVLNTEEIANLLGIGAKTIRKMARNKEIPAKKINNEWRFLKEKIYEWMNQN